jgi:GntR family transcriptional regulator/MocR family aminotransferase
MLNWLYVEPLLRYFEGTNFLRRIRQIASLLWVPIERSSGIPLIRQVYEQVRVRILRGELVAGTRLPSTRQLATDLHVSRNVVLEAYDLLLAEGYIEGRPGSGTYVASGASLQPGGYERDAIIPQRLGTEVVETRDIIDFRSGVPALEFFPRKIWSSLVRRVYMEAPAPLFGYDHPAGRPELREALARYLRRTRGVRCDASQVIVTSGATQAFSLIAQVLLSPHDLVCVEDPSEMEVRQIFSLPGATICPVPVDEYGIQTTQLPVEALPRLIVVTPSHQFPLGGLLPIQRRIQLVQFARSVGCHLVEDDYDSEFRYDGPPVSSLQELDPDHVIYVGTFSKILSPALRQGYLVLPEDLVEQFQPRKRLADLHSPSLDQLVMAQFIEQGFLEQHIVRMRRIYRERRGVLLRALQVAFGERVTLFGISTGLHLVARFQGVIFTEETMQRLQNAGVRVYPVDVRAFHRGAHLDKCILGYGHLAKATLQEGVRRLRLALAL